MRFDLRFYVFCYLVVLAAGSVMAGGELPGAYQDPGLSPNRSTVDHNIDEHIDPFTGKLQLHHVDAVLPGNGGFDLTLQRSYNSPSAIFGSLSDTMSYNRTPNLGVGWNLLIGGRMFNAYGTGGACAGGNQMSFETPDGARQGMIRQGDGTFLSPSRWKATCVTGGVQVNAPNGMRYDLLKLIVENVPGTVQSSPFYYPTHIQDRNGNYADFVYTVVGSTIVLDHVTASDGRRLDFAYGTIGNGTLILLGYVTAGTRTWEFDYYTTPALTGAGGYGTAYHLSDVIPPTGGHWSYVYNGCYNTQPGVCSMIEVTYPEGGQLGYSYSFVDFHDGSGNTSVVATKNIGLFNVLVGSPPYTWQYAYTPGSLGVNDVTTVTTPMGKITYEHVGSATVGSGSTWQIGLLKRRQQQDLASATLQDETYTWDKQQIATYPTYRVYGLNDGVTYAPLMTNHTISRDGFNYTTDFSNFDTYGNPQQIVEAGPGDLGQVSRTTTRAYYTDPVKWIVNTPANETIAGVGTIVRTFDGNANLTGETRYGVATSYTYSPTDGSLTSRTDANAHTTTFSGYLRGVAQTEQRPAGVTITRSVDQDGNITSQSDGAGHVYNYQYDSLRRMIQKTPPIGAAATTVWTGNANRTTTRGAYVETMQFDGGSRPLLKQRNGIKTLYISDPLSNPAFESLPGQVVTNPDGSLWGTGTRLDRDLLGRGTKLTNPDTSLRTMTHVGRTVTELDELNRTSVYHFFAYADPAKHQLVGVDRPNGNNITITRDVLGNITSVKQGTVTRTYGYNASFFLTSIIDPETGTTTFGRDAVGNMTSRTVGGKTTNFAYDGLNRLTGITYPDNSTVAITYLGNGRTASVTNAQATRSYTYDANANLTSETLTVAGQAFTVGYTYDTKDALASITYPRTGEVIAYSPDALGRPITATPFVTAVNYFDSGNAQKISYANGIDYTMDETPRQWPMNQLAQKADHSVPELIKKHFDYDASGNVIQIYEGDFAAPREVLQMTYDRVNEVNTVVGPWGTANISYDAVGNITAYNFNSLTNYYAYANNKLATLNSLAVSYDGYGNVTSDGKHTYQYDDASNLTCVDCGTGNQITYAYDGNNRRVSRTQGSVTTYYVHASNGDLILEYTPAQSKAIEHIYLNGKRIASKTVPQ